MTYDLIYACNAKCFHTIDWYRSVKRVAPNLNIALATDLIDSEGHPVLVDKSDNVIHLVNIDAFLLGHQSRIGDILRNLVKLIFMPLQAIKLRIVISSHPGAVVHAITMYYMMVCWLAGIRFFGTPQGSEILVRSKRKTYGFFAKKAMRSAELITVDSVTMADAIKRLCGVDAVIVQNGVDVSKLLEFANNPDRVEVVSMRGLAPLYRITEIFSSRNHSSPETIIKIAYPFFDSEYKDECESLASSQDQFLGRLPKDELSQLLSRAVLAISIPTSDASPRSVYEAIFSGAIVACTELDWIRMLPASMCERLYIVDLDDPDWFAKAKEYAEQKSKQMFTPCQAAIEKFDQYTSMRNVVKTIYKLNIG